MRGRGPRDTQHANTCTACDATRSTPRTWFALTTKGQQSHALPTPSESESSCHGGGGGGQAVRGDRVRMGPETSSTAAEQGSQPGKQGGDAQPGHTWLGFAVVLQLSHRSPTPAGPHQAHKGKALPQQACAVIAMPSLPKQSRGPTTHHRSPHPPARAHKKHRNTSQTQAVVRRCGSGLYRMLRDCLVNRIPHPHPTPRTPCHHPTRAHISPTCAGLALVRQLSHRSPTPAHQPEKASTTPTHSSDIRAITVYTGHVPSVSTSD